MNRDADVVIGGAGIAGLALAGLLAREGRSVVLVDKAPPPRDRVCGEGIMPMGVAVLRELGLEPESIPGHDFKGLEFHTARTVARVPFRPGRNGRGIRRTTLVEALQGTVRDRPTVTAVRDDLTGPVWENGRIVGLEGRLGRYRGEAVVAADGARSSLLRKAGMRFHERGYRMGLRLHFALPRPLEMEWVRVGLFSPWDVYVTPVSEGELLATTMCDRAAYRRIVTDYPGFLASTPFASLFAGARPASRPLAWHHPLFVPERFTAGGMLAVGDAGGGIDPCLGTGVSFALATAREAARAVAAILDRPAGRPEAENAFEAWRAGLFRHYALFDTVFRSLVTSPFGSEALVWGMRHWPGTAAAITRIVAENAPWHTFPWSSLLRPSWN